MTGYLGRTPTDQIGVPAAALRPNPERLTRMPAEKVADLVLERNRCEKAVARARQLAVERSTDGRLVIWPDELLAVLEVPRPDRAT